MPLYYVNTNFGCGIRCAKDIKQARRDLLQSVGEYGGPGTCRPATEDDIAWVKGMGGYIPPDHYKKERKKGVKSSR